MASSSSEGRYFEKLYGDFDPATVKRDDSNTSSGRKDREEVLPWEDYFMALALLSAKRSKDPKTQVGAVIVRGMSCTDGTKLHGSKKITGIGHNAMPDGCKESQLHWEQRDFTGDDWVDTKYPYVVHAAINAILNKNAEDLTGCTLFTTLLPSNEDTKLIIQAGITKVVYCEDRGKTYGYITQKMLTKAEIECTSFTEYRRKCAELRASECEDLALENEAKKERRRELNEILLYHPHESPSVHLEAKPISDPPEAELITDPQYYMSVALLSQKRSKDPNRPVGACIVDRDGKVVGIGYNGWPYRISDEDPEISWGKDGENPAKMKYPYEANAIMHKTCIDLKGCSIYTTYFPCNECAKLIIQSGITKVYYLEKPDGKLWMKASCHLLRSAGFEVDVQEQPSSQDTTDQQQTDAPGSIEQQADQRQRNASTQTDEKLCEEYKPERRIEIRWPIEMDGANPPKKYCIMF